MHGCGFIWGMVVVSFVLGCSQNIPAGRTPFSAPNPSSSFGGSPFGQKGEIPGMLPTPTASEVEAALREQTFFYQSTHPEFSSPLMVQYQDSQESSKQESSEEANTAFKIILDDGRYISGMILTPLHIVSCSEENLSEDAQKAKISFEGLIELSKVYAQETDPEESLQVVVYEIDMNKPGSEQVPNLIEVIFEKQSSIWKPFGIRLTDSRLEKVICFENN